MQDTSHQLFTESVMDEVLLSMDNEDETVADEILKQFDLLEYKDRHPLSLSGGQKQRVAIASAIVSNREIIVFDEPTSGLDLKHKMCIRDRPLRERPCFFLSQLAFVLKLDSPAYIV